jgi:hypothetical protein
MRSLLIAAAAPALMVAPAQPPAAAGKVQFMSSARFVDTTIGQWRTTPKPELAKKAELGDLEKAHPKGGDADFGLSFNCAVETSGKLSDCRSVYAIPGGADGAALTRSLAPFFRLSRQSAAMAREKAYRVTIDVARGTFNQWGTPRLCTPPFCIVEGATPPPPPPTPEDPAVRDAMDRADHCFQAAWDDSRDKRFAAEKAVRAAADEAGVAAARAAALDYVRSRQALMACIAGLEEASRTLPLSDHDRDAVTQRVQFMRFSYSGQTRYETAILIGALDRHAGEVELSYPY